MGLAVSKDGKKLLTGEELKNVGGGYLYPYGEGVWYDRSLNWEVIDDKTGEVIERFFLGADARAYAEEHGYSTELIDEYDLADLRKKKKK